MPGPRALEALHGWVWDTREANRRSWQRLRGEDWLHGGPAAELGLIGDLQLVVSGADACGFRRYAGCMRYTQGGGLTAEGRRRLEQVRLEAVKRSGTA
jgi:hypothetical protein